jgi:hypothetical protein
VQQIWQSHRPIHFLKAKFDPLRHADASISPQRALEAYFTHDMTVTLVKNDKPTVLTPRFKIRAGTFEFHHVYESHMQSLVVRTNAVGLLESIQGFILKVQNIIFACQKLTRLTIDPANVKVTAVKQIERELGMTIAKVSMWREQKLKLRFTGIAWMGCVPVSNHMSHKEGTNAKA